MSGRIPDAFIDDLLNRVDIVDVISERIPLKKAGRDWSARCPFHDERSPSFTVSPAKQFYHCFGCGAHGSAIRFLMDYDRLEFPDAIEELANRVGLKVPYEAGRRNAPAVQDSSDLYSLLDASAKFFQAELKRSDVARAYFARRGLDETIQAKFGLGWAPDQWDALKKALGTTPQRIALLEKGGMLTTGERGTPYDRFRQRVMFPIQDRRGRVIAFGGRVLEKDEGPKYLNSPETPLFHKGRELFALWQVRQAYSKIPRLIVVEGYMDVIALHQFGLPQAVATLGTATTRDHAELLFRNSADVYFCFDGDRAGRQAGWRAVESVLPRLRDGRQAYFLFLPDGEDPDSLIRKEGVAGFEERLAQATPLSEFFFAELGKDVNVASLDGRARLAERARPLLAQIPDGAFRDLMLAELDRRTGVQVRVDAPPQDHVPARPVRPGERTLVRSAVALLLQNPAFATMIEPPYAFAALRQPGIPLLIELLELGRARPDIAPAAVLEHYAERPEGKSLQKLFLLDLPGEVPTLKAEFADALRQLEKQTAQQRIDDLMRQQGEAGLTDDEKRELRELLAAKNAR